MAAHTASSRGARSLDEVRVEEAMHPGVLTCPLETRLSDVARTMAANRVHCVVGLGDVTEDDTRLWGVISDLDLIEAAAEEDIAGRTAGGSAATEVVTVGPGDPLRLAAQQMAKHRVTHLLVVEPDSDRPVGVLSTLDVAAVLGGGRLPEPDHGAMRVEQLMSSPVVTVSPELPLPEVARLLIRQGISGVPVVRDGEVVGVVSEADILAKERGETTDQQDRFLAWLFGGESDELRAKIAARTAGEAMSSPARTVEFWRSPSAAAALMLEHGVKRLPVLEHGKLVGIVSRGDLVRAFARSDEAIARDIREEVLLHSFWLSPREFDVDVKGGEVELRGTVESAVVGDVLPKAVARVPGVVAVRSELTVRPDEEPPRRFSRLRGPEVTP